MHRGNEESSASNGEASPAASEIAPPRGLTLATAAALLLLVWALFCWPYALAGLTIPWDSKNHFYAQLRFLAAALHDGESVAWAPYVFGGHPQIADPQSLIFAPVMLLLALFDRAPGFTAMDVATLAGLLPGGLGMLLIFRRSGWRLEGGLVAALAFMFGGAAAARLQHTSQILSYGFLPLALWLLMEALDRRSLVYAILFGIAAATMAVGRDQVAFLSCLVLFGYALYAWLGAAQRMRFLATRAATLLVAGASGAALLAIPLLLTAEMAALSIRPAIDFAAASGGSLVPWSLMTLAIPDYFGALHEHTLELYWGPGTMKWGDWANGTDRAVNYLYAGALPALLLAWHGLAGRRLAAREIRYFVIVFVVAALYALGHYTPVFRAMFEFPGVALYRRPADAVFIVGFALAALAGYLAHRLLADGMPRVTRRAWIIMGGAVATIVAGGLAFAVPHQGLEITAQAMAVAAGFIALAVCAVALAAHWRKRALAAASVLVLALAVDLARHNSGMVINARARAEYAALDPAQPNPLADELTRRLAAERAEGRYYRAEILAADGGPWQNAPLVYRIESTLGYNPLHLMDYAKATGAEEASHLERRRFTPLFPGYASPMTDLLGIRFLALGVPIEKLDPKLEAGRIKLVGRVGGVYLYENPGALPRVRVATEIALADTKRLMETGEWPADPREVAILERKPPEWPSPPPPVTVQGSATAAIERYRHDEVVVRVAAPGPAMLVLHDVFHPAWRATVDGRPAPVYRANALFRAVFVPPGEHRVRFTYQPVREVFARMLGLGAP